MCRRYNRTIEDAVACCVEGVMCAGLCLPQRENKPDERIDHYQEEDDGRNDADDDERHIRTLQRR